jgi:hypothetical protein
MSNENVRENVTTVEETCKPCKPMIASQGTQDACDTLFDQAIAELNEIQRGIYDVLVASGTLPTEALKKVTFDFSVFNAHPGIVGSTHFGQMLGYVGLKHDQALILQEKSEELADVERMIRNLQSLLMDEVCNELDPATGKIRYTNDTTRKAACEMKCESDAVFIDLQSRAKDLRSAISTHQNEHRYYADLIAAYEAFASTL